MSPFKGFSAGKQESIPIPAVFFTDLLPQIDNLGELRISIYIFWFLDGQSSEPRFIRFSDLTRDQLLMAAFGGSRGEQEKNLQDALTRATSRETILEARLENNSIYFLNTPRGVAAMAGLVKGAWHPDRIERFGNTLKTERPNIFALYEQNIGPLTPILSETLQEAEKAYPAAWIEEAVTIAVTRNARNWRFVEAILKRWKEEGKDEADRRTSQETRKRDSQGKYGDYVKH
jgi:DNA replication protein